MSQVPSQEVRQADALEDEQEIVCTGFHRRGALVLPQLQEQLEEEGFVYVGFKINAGETGMLAMNQNI